MNFGEIKKNDIANGWGIRVSLFVSGCRNACKNCFNKETWDFAYGTPFDCKSEAKIIEALKPSYVNGLSILGGEPLEPENQPALLDLTEKVKRLYPNKDIWCYTGFTYEELFSKDCRARTVHIEKLLKNINILVDGRYEDALKDISLQFRGSKNQRVIDLNKTRKTSRVCIWENLCR